MALSINALNSAMFSYSQMQTMQSVKTRIDGRNGVLEAEIKSGNGNIEAKKEEMAENIQKGNNIMDNLYENAASINEKLNKTEDPKNTESVPGESDVNGTTGAEKSGDETIVSNQNQDNPESPADGALLSGEALGNVMTDAVTYDASGNISSHSAKIGAIINMAV